MLQKYSEWRSTKRCGERFSAHLQRCWVMAGRVEINSRREDTIKAVHGTDILLLSAGFIPYSACLRGNKGRHGRIFSYLYQGYELQKPIVPSLMGTAPSQTGGCVSGRKQGGLHGAWSLHVRWDHLLLSWGSFCSTLSEPVSGKHQAGEQLYLI